MPLCLTFQAACETFNVRSKHHIQIPKRYTSNAIWEPQQYMLTQSLEPLDLNKGTSPSAHCWSFLPGLRLSEQGLRECSESREPASVVGGRGNSPRHCASLLTHMNWPVANLEKLKLKGRKWGVACGGQGGWSQSSKGSHMA